MKKKFIITCPPQSLILSIAVGIVYNWRVGVATLIMLFALGTILEYLNGRSR